MVLPDLLTKLDAMDVETKVSESKSDNDLTILKTSMDVYWREFQYRHSYAMSLFYRSIIIISVVSILPFIQEGKIGVLQNYAFVFPAIVVPFSFISAWLLYAEFLRMRISLQSYHVASRKLLYQDGTPSRIETSEFPNLFKLSIAKMLAYFVLFLGVFMSFSSIFVLWKSS